jgi:cell division protein FtsN
MADDGLHEIQLNGKQLVFLFMAGTVVAVVIFLSGVMVGRGVRQPQADLAAVGDVVDPTAGVDAPALPLNQERVPVTTQEALSYAERLEAPTPPAEELRAPAVRSESTPAAVPEPAPEPRPDTAAPAVQAASFTEPAGGGWAVQVGAYPRNTADAIAQRLSGKGFPSFITSRPGGLFAVRVGKYSERREADAIAARLERDEQFTKPWVTR